MYTASRRHAPGKAGADRHSRSASSAARIGSAQMIESEDGVVRTHEVLEASQRLVPLLQAIEEALADGTSTGLVRSR